MRVISFFLLGLVIPAFVRPGNSAEPVPPLTVVISASKGQLSHFQKYLEENYQVRCSVIEAPKGGEMTGIENLDQADVLLNNLYRTEPTPEQLERFKEFFASKKGVVGLRKASHSFQNWLAADKEVLGAKYGGHFLLNHKDLILEFNDKAKHRLLVGDYVEVLQTGGLPGDMMPQSWVRITDGRRVFYTRYDPDDLKKDEACRQMVVNALFWAADRQVMKK